MPKYRFIKLTEAEEIEVNRQYLNGKTHRERERAHAILLSHRGQSMDQIAETFKHTRDTICHWFNVYEGEKRFSDKPRSGRPPILSAEEKKSSFNRTKPS